MEENKVFNLKANSETHMRLQINKIKRNFESRGYKVTTVEDKTYGFGKMAFLRLIYQKDNESKTCLINVDKLWKKTPYDLFYAENPQEVRHIHKHGGTDDF